VSGGRETQTKRLTNLTGTEDLFIKLTKQNSILENGGDVTLRKNFISENLSTLLLLHPNAHAHTFILSIALAALAKLNIF
jgi:hypothetical protein